MLHIDLQIGITSTIIRTTNYSLELCVGVISGVLQPGRVANVTLSLVVQANG